VPATFTHKVLDIFGADAKQSVHPSWHSLHIIGRGVLIIDAEGFFNDILAFHESVFEQTAFARAVRALMAQKGRSSREQQFHTYAGLRELESTHQLDFLKRHGYFGFLLRDHVPNKRRGKIRMTASMMVNSEVYVVRQESSETQIVALEPLIRQYIHQEVVDKEVPQLVNLRYQERLQKLDKSRNAAKRAKS
jgi:hypothetical protein